MPFLLVLVRLLVVLVPVVLMPAVAMAQPAAQSDYETAPGVQAPGVNVHIPSIMGMWCDDTALLAATPALSQACTPRVTSLYFPLPVRVVGGTAPGGASPSPGNTPSSSTATYSAPVSRTVSASTQLIGANSTRRALSVIPATPGAPCFMDPSGGTASAASWPIPNGWSWTQTDPPPAGGVTAYCSTPTQLVTTEAN